ncbi:MAG TPA: hypothetical protein VMT91_12090 [Anaerolineales bacterium]|nr:hypothetical protein [Anaerolineales bacterium]
MTTKNHLALRNMGIAMLVLLGLQYEFGMAVNIANPPTLAPLGFSLNGISSALQQAGAVTVIHASLGSGLVIFSLINLFLSLRSGLRSVQVFGSLAFLTTLLAAITGLLFTLSGFQNDGDTHGMATNFLLSFTFYFLELYFLKPARLSS